MRKKRTHHREERVAMFGLSGMPAVMVATITYLGITVPILALVTRAAARRSGRSRRALQHVMTQPLPAVIPAWTLDASDTTPDYGACPECYLLWLHRSRSAAIPRTADGAYVQPSGPAHLCPEHAHSTLGRALQREEATR